MSQADGLNSYTCKNCNQTIITKDAEQGVTPMFITCKIKNCGGVMQSNFYPKITLDKEHMIRGVWRKPTRQEVRKAKGDMRNHLSLGGLIFQEIVLQFREME